MVELTQYMQILRSSIQTFIVKWMFVEVVVQKSHDAATT